VSFLDSDVDRPMEPRSAGTAVGVAEATHEAIREQLSEYQDNTLSGSDRRRVEDHLLRCDPCRVYDATLRATRAALASLPLEQAPARAKQRLRDIAQP
jgi:anti-sigma factor RsiW